MIHHPLDGTSNFATGNPYFSVSISLVINFSPALDLCNVARGRMDGVVDKGTTPEDHVAGSLILTEAGGIVENFSTQIWNVNEAGIIVTSGSLQNVIAGLVR